MARTQRAKVIELEAAVPEDLVGAGMCGARSARIWVRSQFPGYHALELWPEDRPKAVQGLRFSVGDDPAADHTLALDFPKNGEVPLEPLTTYRFRVVREADRALVGEGRFETAPADAASAPDRFGIAFFSCNQPFDASGRLRDASLRSIAVLERALEEHGVKRVLMLGDQMYADYPRNLSLFDEEYFARLAPEGTRSILDCSSEQVRRIYQLRHRMFWKPEALRRTMADYACGMMLDDHEIVDNFGSSPEHASPRWQSLRRGALDAFYDYQGRRAAELATFRPPSMHFSWRYGPVAGFVMDLRSQKSAQNGEIRIYDDAQLAALSGFLRAHADAPFLLLGLSVPLVHLPDWLANFGSAVMGEQSDAADRWTHPKAERSRNRLVRLLQEHQLLHPEQRILLLSGDIHCGLASEVSWLTTQNKVWQLISSAVANVEGPLYRSMAAALPRISMGRTVDGGFGWTARLLPGDDGADENPFAGLNVGIVEFERTPAGWSARYLLISHDASDPPAPRVVLRVTL